MHLLVPEHYRSVTGGGEDVSEAYRGSFELMRSTRAYAPPMVTEKPTVRGPQTAVVVGDNEISCDEYGRIKVLFHWDRGPDKSMWCRVSQVWAGKGWGGMFIPRKGMEVIVDFLEGNPDQPIIVGCVYNADNMPPYPLAGQKNIAGLKTNSTEGGGGYNEIAMDDTKGKELIRTHAQYDQESKIENDERRTVGVDRKTIIGKDDLLNVGKNLKVLAGDSIVLEVGAAKLTMKKDGTITLNGKDITVTGTGNIETKAGIRSKHKATADMIIQGGMVKINS
jgi:type VI secretion system secreted protein VgrG